MVLELDEDMAWLEHVPQLAEDPLAAFRAVFQDPLRGDPAQATAQRDDAFAIFGDLRGRDRRAVLAC